MKRKLLSILLALSMALTLLPMTALAAEGEDGADTAENGNVAKIGNTEYATLAEAIDAAGDGATVKLLADITGQTVIPEGKNIVLDLNGKTMTHNQNRQATICNNGKLTICDSSSEKSGTIKSIADAAIVVGSNSETTITYAKVEAVEGAVVTSKNTGAKVTITDGEFVISDNAVIAGNGSARDGEPNTIIINGGKFTGNIQSNGYIACGIYAPWKDIVTVNGGEFTVNNGIGIVARAGQVTVNGGTFTCNGSAKGKVGDKHFDMDAAQCLYFDATNPAYPAYNSETDFIKVTGGTFDSNVSAYVANGYVQNGNTVEALSNTNAAAQIGDNYYATLAAAYAAATTADIKLLKDAVNVELTGQRDRMVTIDLNGHTLTGKITKDHDLTIKDSSDEKNGVAHFDYVRCNVLKLDSGNVTIDDAKILHTVQITGANVTINGGEYRLGGDGHDAAISKTSGSLTVNSGRFWTNHNLVSDDTTKVVSYTDENNHMWYTVGKTTQGNYKIKKTGPGKELYFCDLTTAALAAQDRDIITLLADQTITEQVVVNSSVTIDGGGCNIQLDTSLKTAGIVDNYAHGVFQFKGDNKTAAVKNFKFENIVINTVLLRAYNSDSNSTLTVENCSFKNIKVMNVIRAASGTAVSSKLIVTGCTFDGCTATSNGIIQIDSNSDSKKNATSVIKSNDFIGNKTEVFKKQGDTNSNAATVYLSAPATVMNNYFKGNTTKPDDDSSKNGIIVTGSNAVGSAIQENAFVSHTFTNGDAQGAIYGAKGETTVSKNYYGEGIAHLANQDANFTEGTTSGEYLKEVGKPGVHTNLTPKSLTAGTYEYAGDNFAGLVASGYRATQGGDGTWTVSVIPSSSDGGSSSGSTTTKTETTTNPDGSTTKTETKSDGSTVETTTGKDGSTTKTETKKDGSSVTESKDASGSTGTVKTDKDGKAEAETKLSSKAVEDAKKNGEAVKAPVEVEAGKDSASAPTVKIDLPSSAGETKVEIPVSNVSSGTVAVIVKPDGTEEIVKTCVPTENGVILSVEGGATVKIIDNSKDFIDTRDHWSREEVNFVASRELFNGVGDNLFGVSGEMTRGMVNTVLARLAGADTTGGSIWYEKGTEWAKANGISDGTNPEASVTREQLATMLYRFAGSPAVSGELSFADADRVSGYAQNAMLWAVQNGILNGIGDNLIAPQSSAERAQVAAMMARYLKNIG